MTLEFFIVMVIVSIAGLMTLNHFGKSIRGTGGCGTCEKSSCHVRFESNEKKKTGE